MADISEVQLALGALVAQAVYPRGVSGSSLTGGVTTVKLGWPLSTRLDADLKAYTTTVSIYPLDMERNTTRHLRRWSPGVPPVPRLFLSVDNQTITVAGEVPTPFVEHNLAVLIGGHAYTYAVQQSDDLLSIATALAFQIDGARSAGPVITLPAAAEITARVGTVGEAVQELKRQERVVQITIWAPSPAARTAASKAIDAALADTAFLTMPDATAARVRYLDSPMTDGQSKVGLYRRDFRYQIDFATTKVQAAAQVTVGRVVRKQFITGVDESTQDY